MKLALVLLISSIANVALAHPGHGALSSDQSAHWLVEHPLLIAGGMAIAAGLGVFLLRLRARR